MADIAQIELQGIFTKKLIAVYRERISPSMFFKSFFPSVETDTLQISIEVRRATEKIAVDVERGTFGNRNTFSKSTEKLFIPPLYQEYFEATDLDFYDRLFGKQGMNVEPRTMAEWINSVIVKIAILRDKIDRAYELLCAQVFYTGIIQLTNGDNINFKRKAASLVDLGGGSYWDEAGGDPFKDLQDAGLFIRKEGKTRSSSLVMILDAESLEALLNNTKFVDRADNRRINRADVTGPQKDALGANFHGTFTAGDFIVQIWTYPEFFEDESGTLIPYVTPKQVVVLPENPNFEFAFAGLPVIMGTQQDVITRAVQTQRGAFHIGEYIDPRRQKHEFDIRSAGLPVPIAIDQIYTVQVLTS